MPLLRHALTGLAELLLPAVCPACSALTDEDSPFCAVCARTFDRIDEPCPRCAMPVADPVREPVAMRGAICPRCARAPHPWTTLRAPYAFAGELAVAIRRWKFAPDAGLTRPLAQLLAPSLAACAGADALVPVPLHPSRLRRREFNQSSLLVRRASRLLRRSRGLHVPPVLEALDRVRDTPPQSRLGADARHANLRGAFIVPKRRSVAGLHLVLVDDVLTTGATAAACSRALLRGGARRVDVLTLARTLP